MTRLNIFDQVVTPKSSSTSKNITTQIRGGDLGKDSSPGARAPSDTCKHTEEKFKGEIKKAQSVIPEQLQKLRKLKSID